MAMPPPPRTVCSGGRCNAPKRSLTTRISRSATAAAATPATQTGNERSPASVPGGAGDGGGDVSVPAAGLPLGFGTAGGGDRTSGFRGYSDQRRSRGSFVGGRLPTLVATAGAASAAVTEEASSTATPQR